MAADPCAPAVECAQDADHAPQRGALVHDRGSHAHRRPAFLAERKIPAWGAAVLFIGQKGMLIADYGNHQLLPQAQYAGFQRPEQTIPTALSFSTRIRSTRAPSAACR